MEFDEYVEKFVAPRDKKRAKKWGQQSGMKRHVVVAKRQAVVDVLLKLKGKVEGARERNSRTADAGSI